MPEPGALCDLDPQHDSNKVKGSTHGIKHMPKARLAIPQHQVPDTLCHDGSSSTRFRLPRPRGKWAVMEGRVSISRILSKSKFKGQGTIKGTNDHGTS